MCVTMRQIQHGEAARKQWNEKGSRIALGCARWGKDLSPSVSLEHLPGIWDLLALRTPLALWTTRFFHWFAAGGKSLGLKVLSMVWRPLSFFTLISMLSENIQFYLSAYLLQQCNKQGETCKQNLHDHPAAACHQVTPLSVGNKIPHCLYPVNILAHITGQPPGLDRFLYKTAEETTQRAAACSQLPLIHKPVWICFGWCHLVFPVHRGHCMLLVQQSVTIDSLQKLLFLSWCLSGQWQQGSVSLKELSRSAGGKVTWP